MTIENDSDNNEANQDTNQKIEGTDDASFASNSGGNSIRIG